MRQTATATRSIALSPGRIAAGEAYRPVQFSSMYVDENVHDSDGGRFKDAAGSLVRLFFGNLAAGALFPAPALALGAVWVDSLHTDDAGFQGNTPNVRVAFDDRSQAAALLPRGFIKLPADPSQDNVGVFVHDTSAPAAFAPGEQRTIQYVISAHDDPFLAMDRPNTKGN